MTRLFKISALALALAVFSPMASSETSVNINTDSIKTMAKHLDGVGVRRAAAISKHRKENGDFKSVDDLAKVKGISKSLVERNRDRIVVGMAEEGEDE